MDWKQIIGTVAPWIGTALGGPLGGLAVGAVADALGISDKTEASIKQALSGVTPEQMLALKNADQAFAVKMQELGFSHIEKLAELEVADRTSARDREVKTGDHTNRNLAYAYTIGYFVIIGIVIVNGIDPAVKELVNALLGMLSAALIGINSYYFGSSSGSAAKTQLMAEAAQKTGA